MPWGDMLVIFAERSSLTLSAAGIYDLFPAAMARTMYPIRNLRFTPPRFKWRVPDYVPQGDCIAHQRAHMDAYWNAVLNSLNSQLSFYIRPVCFKDIHWYIHNPRDACYDIVKARTFVLYVVYAVSEVSIKIWRSPGRDAVQFYATRLALEL